MPNNNDDRKLLLYISISIILHLLILYFLPIGFLHGSAQSESDLNDYGYVQLVDYQPAPVEEETSEQDTELTEDPAVEELQEIEENKEPEPIDEPEPEESVEEDLSEPEPEPEIEEVIEDVENEVAEEPVEELEEVEPAEETEPETEVVQEAEPEPEPEVEETEEEVMASEESESEVEVVQEETSENEVLEKDNEPAVEKEINAEEENLETDTAEQEEESTPPPPPPPTSGDLIGLIEPPTFPKDLVGSRSEGTVSLMVEISTGGDIKNIEIVESSGYDSMDRVAQLTLEHGWEFKEYQQSYRIPVSVRYYIDQSDNSQVEVDIGQVDFISGGE